MKTIIYGKEITLSNDLAEAAKRHGLDLDDESIASYIKIQNAHCTVDGSQLVAYSPANKKELFEEKTEEELSDDLRKYVENHIKSTTEMKNW